MIREPIAIPSPAADHHHRQHPALTSNNNHNNSTIIDIDSSVVARTTDFFVDSSSPAMTGHGTTRRSRNPTTDALQDSSPLQRLATTTTTTTTPIRQPLPQHHNNNNNNNANDSPSVQSQISSGAGWQWEQNNNHDHDPIENEEQALFEQRLCEDIYGVAVRKINQNGKSNLRYVKCCIVDTCELLDNSSFSNRSVSSNRSSRSSSLRRTGFSFKNNSNSSCRDDRSLERCSSSVGAAGSGSKNKYNNNHSTTNSTTQVLTWGKKKDVKIPLEKFVSVRKGKTTDRTKRNSFPASRILSLITEDPYVYSNLDIEAPTRLDRDKFARAFSRFLGIPLLEQQQQQGTTRTSDNDIDIIRSGDVRSSDNIMTSPQSIMKGKKQQQLPQPPSPVVPLSPPTTSSSTRQQQPQTTTTTTTANNSVPTSSSHTTNNSSSSRKHIPLPVVTTTTTTTTIDNNHHAKKSNHHYHKHHKKGVLPPPRGGGVPKATTRRTTTTTTQQAAAVFSSSFLNNHPPNINSVPLDIIPDPQITSLPSSTNNDDDYDAIPLSQQQQQNTIMDSVRVSEMGTDRSLAGSTPRVHLHDNHDDHDHGEEEEDGSVVSSITGAGGYDQEIVEELHMALTELRAELEESRTEAARAVKVAEQAIQSAENNTSQDWNSTVTHKAAEAAALAQKKSAEAMSKARLAEERLEGERKAARIWKKQAEAAEEEAGHWQTRAAAAEVQRAALMEGLESERGKAAMLLASMKQRFTSSETHQRDAVDATMERNRALELELEILRQSLSHKNDEVATLQDCLTEIDTSPEAYKALAKKKPSLVGRGKRSDDRDGAATALLSANSLANHAYESRQSAPGTVSSLELSRVHSEVQIVRKQFELLKKATSDELQTLPDSAKLWAEQTSQAVLASQSEIDRLKSKLAMESASRRKLLHEVQDLRGTVRVYCRQRSAPNGVSTISTPSQELLLLNCPGFKDGASNSFQFDGILGSDIDQQDLYDELDDVCLSALDGFNVCIMAYGQSGSGKTYTMVGEVAYGSDNNNKENVVSIKNYGIHLRAAQQFFNVLKHRSERYQDVVTFSIVEVYDERLCDLLAGTDIGETNGKMEGSRKSNRKRIDSHDGSMSSLSRLNKLEIKTNHNGETVVHGLLSVEVNSFDDVIRVWKECLSKRKTRLSEQGVDFADYESNTHVIGTLKVFSTNIATGLGTTGKIQFVDLASSDVVPHAPKRNGAKKAPTPEGVLSGFGNKQEWKYANKSLSTLREVVNARSQFQRSVPYRNSTITHLLSDSLEADTKVALVACVSSEAKDLQETAFTLKFAQNMRKVAIGKATKHILSHA